MQNKKYKPPFFARPLYKEIKSNEGVFDDETYFYAGSEKELKKFRIISIISCVLAAAIVLGEASLRIEAMQSTLYIIIPYMIEFIGVFLFIIFSLNLAEHAKKMSKKKYEQTIKSIPFYELIAGAGACAGIVGSIIYLIINGFEGCTVARLVYIIFKAILIAIMIFMFVFLGKNKWQE